MEETSIIILAETCHDLVDRFAPLLEEIRRKLGAVRFVGVFAGFELGNRRIEAGDLFAEVHFVARPAGSRSLIRSLPHHLLIAFINHNATFRDCQLYAVARSSSPRTAYLFRNSISLVNFLTTGNDDRHAVRPLLVKARRDQLAIQVKAFLLAVLAATIIWPGRLLLRLIPRSDGKKRILFIKQDVLGDMIVALPYLAALRKAFGNAELTVLASSRGAAIVREQGDLHPHGLCDHLLVWDAPWHLNFPRPPGLEAVWQLLRQVPQYWKQRYDLAIQPVNFGTGIIFAALTLAQRVVAIMDARLPLAMHSRSFISDPVEVNHGRMHHLQDFTEQVVARLGVRRDPAVPVLLVSAQARSKVEQFLEDKGYRAGQKLLLFNVGAGHPLRVWGAQKFAQLADQVSTSHDVMIVLTGSPGEREMASEIAALSAVPVANSAGLFSLNELIALTCRSDLVVTVDTGIMHLAAALQTALIAIFGAGLVDYCRPLNRNHIIVKEELGCSGCSDRCFVSGTPPCLERVTVEMVLSAVEQMLSPPSESSRGSL